MTRDIAKRKEQDFDEDSNSTEQPDDIAQSPAEAPGRKSLRDADEKDLKARVYDILAMQQSMNAELNAINEELHARNVQRPKA